MLPWKRYEQAQHVYCPNVTVPLTKTSIPFNSNTSPGGGLDYPLLPKLPHPRGDQVLFGMYTQSGLGNNSTFVSSHAPIAWTKGFIQNAQFDNK